MRPRNLSYCPSTLAPGFTSYCPIAQQQLFGSRTKKVSHVLPFPPPGKNPQITRQYNEKRKSISISGVQEKYSLLLRKNALDLTSAAGTHILKPIPSERLERVEDMPANEHVTMQIARQLYQINTAACGMIFFDDGSPAYITRRFDYKRDGSKYQVEDFAALLNKSPEREGNDFKYNASYLDIATAIKKYTAASPVELIRFFRTVLFNYLFANGDAHLKNFSLLESDDGDYLLAPAYDLLCTALHLDDGNLALSDGLYEGDMDEQTFNSYGIYTGQSFMKFASKMDIPAPIATKILSDAIVNTDPAKEMIMKSFLSNSAKKKYIAILEERRKRLLIK